MVHKSKVFHFKSFGSVRFMSDEGGNVVQEYVYDGWGNLVSSSGSVSQPYEFVGREGYYREGELYLLGQRWYDSSAGRFISRDIIFNLNLYIYALNSPINYIDPFGSQPSGAIPRFEDIPTREEKNKIERSKSDSLEKCLEEARNKLIICISGTQLGIGAFETTLFFGCLLAGPGAVGPCLAIANIMCLPSNVAAITTCMWQYIEDRRECYKKYKKIPRPLNIYHLEVIK